MKCTITIEDRPDGHVKTTFQPNAEGLVKRVAAGDPSLTPAEKCAYNCAATLLFQDKEAKGKLGLILPN